MGGGQAPSWLLRAAAAAVGATRGCGDAVASASAALHNTCAFYVDCALQVATSDGVLRCYTFGRMTTPSSPAGPCIVAPPQQLPAPPALAAGAAPATPVAAAPPALASAEERAAEAALPDEESDLEEEEEEEGGAAAAEAKAAATALPESDFEVGLAWRFGKRGGGV